MTRQVGSGSELNRFGSATRQPNLSVDASFTVGPQDGGVQHALRGVPLRPRARRHLHLLLLQRQRGADPLQVSPLLLLLRPGELRPSRRLVLAGQRRDCLTREDKKKKVYLIFLKKGSKQLLIYHRAN